MANSINLLSTSAANLRFSNISNSNNNKINNNNNNKPTGITKITNKSKKGGC